MRTCGGGGRWGRDGNVTEPHRSWKTMKFNYKHRQVVLLYNLITYNAPTLRGDVGFGCLLLIFRGFWGRAAVWVQARERENLCSGKSLESHFASPRASDAFVCTFSFFFFLYLFPTVFREPVGENCTFFHVECMAIDRHRCGFRECAHRACPSRGNCYTASQLVIAW